MPGTGIGSRPRPSPKRDLVKQKFLEGKTLCEIVGETGISRSSVTSTLSQLGFSLTGNTKAPRETVRKIEAALLGGATQTETSRSLKVSPTVVHRIFTKLGLKVPCRNNGEDKLVSQGYYDRKLNFWNALSLGSTPAQARDSSKASEKESAVFLKEFLALPEPWRVHCEDAADDSPHVAEREPRRKAAPQKKNW